MGKDRFDDHKPGIFEDFSDGVVEGGVGGVLGFFEGGDSG